MLGNLLNINWPLRLGLLFLAALLLLVVSLFYVQDSLPNLNKSIVATVADRTISVTDFTRRMTLRSAGMTEIFAADHKKQALLDEMIKREVQIIAAKKAGYDTDPAIVKTLENMMVTKLREQQLKKILAKLTISEDEIAEYYLANSKKYSTPAMSRAAIIHFAVSDKATKEKQAEVKARADKVFKLAQTLPESVTGFGALAAKYSEDQASRDVGGDVGWLVQGRNRHSLDDAVIKAVTTLNNKGDMVFPLRGKDGYYLVKLIDKKLVQQKKLDQVSRNIRLILRQQKYQQAEEKWLLSLKEEVSPVIVHQAVFKSVQPPPSTITRKDKQRPPALPNG